MIKSSNWVLLCLLLGLHVACIMIAHTPNLYQNIDAQEAELASVH